MLWKIAYLTQTLYLYNYNGIVFRRHLTNASSYHNSRYSIERFNQKYESLLSIKKSLMNLAELNIDNKARRKLYKFTKFNNIRLSAYTTKSIFNILKVVFMKKYFDSMKTYLLDIFLILKYSNKTSKSKGD